MIEGDDIDRLEALIDRYGIAEVLMSVSELCGRKSEHIATNWQDAALAKRWATLEGAVGVIVPKAGGL
ncbi:MAG TPA: hypothetical protein VF077_03875 [Nitrospiraceae bacterium]